MCAYLTERAAGASPSPASTRPARPSAPAPHYGLEDPIAHEAVRQVRRGLRRILGTAPRRPARPLGVAQVCQIITCIDRDTHQGARDAALILVGFASALRCGELAALTLADIEAKPTGPLLTVRRSKTDPERHGQIVGVAHGQHAITDPVAALASWTAVRGTAPGALFTSMRPGCPSLEPISGAAAARVVKLRAEAAGLATERITGHSLRAGRATTLPWPASAWTGSPPRPATDASTSSSSATSARRRPSSEPPAATSGL